MSAKFVQETKPETRCTKPETSPRGPSGRQATSSTGPRSIQEAVSEAVLITGTPITKLRVSLCDQA